MIKIIEMPIKIKRTICIQQNSNTIPDITFHVTGEGNIFIQQGDGLEMTDFWVEIPLKEWMEVNTFIESELKRP